MYRVAQWLAAVASQKDLMNLTGLVADRRGPRHALQGVEILKARAIRTDLAQQAGSDFGPRSRQGAKQLVIGVLGKELLDLSAVGIDLALERAQHAGPSVLGRRRTQWLGRRLPCAFGRFADVPVCGCGGTSPICVCLPLAE